MLSLFATYLASAAPPLLGAKLYNPQLSAWDNFVSSWDFYLGQKSNGWFKGVSDFSAGMGDTVSGGLTRRARQAFGYNDVVDMNSDAYRYGGYAGQVVNIGLMLGNPTGWAKTAVAVLNVAATVEGGIAATESVLEGKGWSQAMMVAAGAGASWLRGMGSPCQVGQSLSRFGQVAKTLGTNGQRALAVFGMASGASSGISKIADGDVVGGLLDIVGAGASAYRFMQSCFTGDRLVETDQGPRRIDSIQKGNRLLARSEGDLNGPLEYKEVLQTFVRVAPVLNLHVAGKLIPTTKEHPFWLKEIGWMPAGELMPGDLIAGKLEGEWLRVEGVADSGQVLTVYNLKVSEYHTYFVGGEDWGFSVWAHNADYPSTPKRSERPDTVEKIGGAFPRGSRWAGRTYNFQGVKDPELRAALQAKYPNGVKFDAKGFPEFEPHLHQGGPGKLNDVRIEMSGSYREDYARANRAAGFDNTPDGYVWHHHQDTGRMQLVRTDVHDNTRHSGGVNFWELANGTDYRR